MGTTDVTPERVLRVTGAGYRLVTVENTNAVESIPEAQRGLMAGSSSEGRTSRTRSVGTKMLRLENGQVSFRWKDYRDRQHPDKVMTVAADEFIRLFLRHALPTGFQRIRYYGFLANCHRIEKLELCRRLLASGYSDLLPTLSACCQRAGELRARDRSRCPRCRVGELSRYLVLPPWCSQWGPADTS